MALIRQDAWTEQDDLYLADVTLRCIRNGDTQLAAFEEVAVRLGRTSAACGFRWNSVVRKQYETSIQLAKAQRVKKNKLSKIHSAEPEMVVEIPKVQVKLEKKKEQEMDIDFFITWLQQQKSHLDQSKSLDHEYRSKLKESELHRERLMQEVNSLKDELSTLRNDYQVLDEDFKTFLHMMERARKMTYLNDDMSMPRMKFRMETNGNLEQFG